MSDPSQYTIGWICALETEYVAARSFLETKHDRPETLPPNDNNHYTLGEIGGHNVAIAVLPDGEYGTSSAAGVARDMVHSFPNIRFGLMVGIGGGVPRKHDIRLGDVVVSASRNGRGGLIQYDLGKEIQGQEFRQTGFLNQAPPILRTAVSGLQAQYEEEGNQLEESVHAVLERNKRLKRKYARPAFATDRLYESEFAHPNLGASCSDCCGLSCLIRRAERGEEKDDPAIHYGLIASGNRVIKDAISRDRLAAKEDILCFDMEGAGLMNHFPCLVIRGICDYADSHKSKEWQGYAAMVAAAYARDLLNQIVPQRVNGERKAIEAIREIGDSLDDVSRNVDSIRTITTGSSKKIEHVAQHIDLKELPVAEGAEFGTYMDQHEEECLHGTRTDLLHTIEEWAVLPEGKCMFWLNGLAGTGKSTISRTVAKTFQEQGLLAASFFFKRGEGDRGNANRFFPTIARQLFSEIPELRGDILQVIQKNPGIAVKPLKEQYEQLIHQPLDAFYRLQLRSSPLVIVIDALDECENENDIRVILQQLPRTHTSPSSYLRFFITSRPELPVRLGFQEAKNSYQDLILHEIPAPVVEHDIALFLEHKLAKIRTQRGLSLDWPGNDDFQTLLSMSIPLFNFAATICRLFDDYNLDPEQCLAEILQYQSEESKLGRTYLPVLKRLVSRYDGMRQTQLVQEVQEVLGTIILLESPLSVISLSRLMGFPISSVRARLSSLHSVLDIPDNEVLPVRIYHLSFRDFLLDPNTRKQTPLLTNYCLCIMEAKLKTNICNLPGYGTGRDDISGQAISQHLLPELQYACRYWIHHIAQSKDILIQIDDVLALLEVHFLHWVEVMSILGVVSEVIGGIMTLKALLPEDKGVRLSEFLDDAKRFILKNRQIADIAPLQIYMSGLLFAPKKSIVRDEFGGEIPSWIHQWPPGDERWSSVLQTLEGSSLQSVGVLAFSPDSQLLASGAACLYIDLWETSTGALKYTLTSRSDKMHSLAFSPDGRLLASGCGNAIELWDPATGTLRYTITDSLNHFSRNFSHLMTQLPSFSPRDWHDMLLSGFTKPINKPSLQGDQWISFRGRRELWLPPDYRPSCSAVKDGAIALGCDNGRIHVIMFSI
ncbi:WD domain protein [Aspergillus pseudoustus]|uniref:WD domain protein n=1 Tax=Aspergillus pseudoustus TaxID=1810923 RepID=A0ABR4KDI5_9EURO